MRGAKVVPCAKPCAMSETDSQRSSGTDWARVPALTDSEIDTSDVPPLDDAFFTRARLRMPPAGALVEMSDLSGD